MARRRKNPDVVEAVATEDIRAGDVFLVQVAEPRENPRRRRRNCAKKNGARRKR